MVACGHDVGPGLEQASRDPVGYADAVRCVLAVDDAEADLELFAQRGQVALDRAATGGAEHVGEKEDSQGSATLAA